MPNAIITPPRVPLIDPRTGLIDRAWFLFFLSLNNVANDANNNPDVGPSVESLLSAYDAALQSLAQEVGTQPVTVETASELTKQIEGVSLENQYSDLVSQVAELQKQVEALSAAPQPVALAQATSSSDGYLTSTDWTTFNSKQPVANPATKAADFTVADNEVWLINNKTSTCTVTLPSAVSFPGRVLHFTNYQPQLLVAASSDVLPITGGTTFGTAILPATDGAWATVVSNGTNWRILQAG